MDSHAWVAKKQGLTVQETVAVLVPATRTQGCFFWSLGYSFLMPLYVHWILHWMLVSRTVRTGDAVEDSSSLPTVLDR